MQVIKSLYLYYQELMLKSEENKKSLEALLKESHKLFENLNGNIRMLITEIQAPLLHIITEISQKLKCININSLIN